MFLAIALLTILRFALYECGIKEEFYKSEVCPVVKEMLGLVDLPAARVRNNICKHFYRYVEKKNERKFKRKNILNPPEKLCRMAEFIPLCFSTTITDYEKLYKLRSLLRN